MAPRRIDAAVLADLFSRAAELRAGRGEEVGAKPERSRALIEEVFARARALREASDEGPVLPPGIDGAATDPPTELSTRPPPSRPARMDHGKAVEEFRRTLEALFEGSGEADLEALASASGVLEAVTTPAPPEPPVASAPPARPGPLPARERLFSAAAEAIFGDRLDELERLVLATFEGRAMSRPDVARGSTPPSPELHAVEPGDPLLPAPPRPQSPAGWLADTTPAPKPARWMTESSVDGLLSGFELPGGAAPVAAARPTEPVPDRRVTESAVDGVLAGFHFDGGDPVPAALAGPRVPPPSAGVDPYAARAVAPAPSPAGPSPPGASGSWGGDSGTGSTVGFDPLRVYAKGTPAAAPPPVASPAAALDLGASFDGFGWPGGVAPPPAPAPASSVATRLVIPVPSDVEDAPETPALRPTRPLGRPEGRPVPGASASATIGFDGVLPASPAHGSPTIGFDGVLPARTAPSPGATIGFDGVLPARTAPSPGATIGFDGVLPASPAHGSPTIGFDGVLPASPAHGSPTIGFDGVLPARPAPGPGATLGFDGVLPARPAPGPGATLGFDGVLPVRPAPGPGATLGFEGVLPAPARPGPGSGQHRRTGFAQTVAFDDVLPPPVVTPPLPARSNAPWLLSSGSSRALGPQPDASSTLGFDGVLGAPPSPAPPAARPPEARPGRPEVLTSNAAQSARGPRGAGPGPLADFLRALPPGADPLAPAQGRPGGAPQKRPTPGAGVPPVRPDPFAGDPFAPPGAPAVIGGPVPVGGRATTGWPTPPTAAWPAPGDPFAPRPGPPGFVDPFRRDPGASDRPTVYPEEPTVWNPGASARSAAPPGRSGGAGAFPPLPPPPGRSGGSGAFQALPPQQPPPAQRPPGRSGGSGAWGTLPAQPQQQPQQPQPPKQAPRPKPLPPGPAPGAPGFRASGEGFDPTAPSWWDGEEPPAQ